MDTLFLILFRVLEAMFVIGVVGCLAVVPVTAYKLFSVLFEKNEEPDTGPQVVIMNKG